jgi:hypothetical protein
MALSSSLLMKFLIRTDLASWTDHVSDRSDNRNSVPLFNEFLVVDIMLPSRWSYSPTSLCVLNTQGDLPLDRSK